MVGIKENQAKRENTNMGYNWLAMGVKLPSALDVSSLCALDTTHGTLGAQNLIKKNYRASHLRVYSHSQMRFLIWTIY